MNNKDELLRWFVDAKDCLERAELLYKNCDWRGVIQNAQLCIELSAKAFIAYFEEPQWRHDIGRQIKKILEKNQQILAEKLNHFFYNELIALSEKVDEIAPWHAWSVYGKEDEEGNWIPAVKLCKKDSAEELIKIAKKFICAVNEFLSKIEEK